MPTIAAGASATVSLVAGTRVLVSSGTVIATVGPGPYKGQQYQLNGSGAVGPFTAAQDVYLTAVTAALYGIDQQDPSASPLTPAAAAAVQAGAISQAANDTSSASTASSVLQAALALGGDKNLSVNGVVFVSETTLIPSNTRLRLVSGTTLRLTGTYGRTMLRNGNACTSGNLTIGACFVICADAVTPSGTGNIRSIASPARLFYTAPGDSEGTAVDVSGADGKYTLTSANGQRLYVSVARSFLNAGVSQAVKVVSACDGAVSATWSRNTTTLTINEVGHNRRAGDAVTLFGATVAGLYYIDTVSGDTWSVADTRGAGSGSCAAFGSRNIEISVDNGALIDYDEANRSIVNQCNDTHAVIINSASVVSTPGFRLRSARKYAFYATHVADLTSSAFEVPVTKSDGWHVNGPCRGVRVNGVRGKADDNLTALGNSDFAPYVINWNNDFGSGDVINATIQNVFGANNKTELCRLYSTTGKVFRNIALSDFSGTVDSTTTSVIALSTDTGTPVENAVELNIDGLTVERIAVRRSDGGELYVFSDISTAAATVGKRKNVLLRDITLPDPMGDPSNPVTPGAGKNGAIRVAGNYDSLTIQRVRSRLNIANGFEEWKGTVFSTSNGANIRSLVIDDVKFANNNTLLPTSLFSAILRLEPSTTVLNATVQNVDLQEVNATGTKATIVYNNGGTLTNVAVRNVSNLDGDSIVRNSSTGTTTNVTIENAYANNSSTFTVANDATNSMNINLYNIRGQFNSLFRTAAGGGTFTFRGAGITATIAAGAGMFNGTYTGITLNVSGVEFVIDLANVALSRTVNKGNIVKTKAIAGTIPAGVLAVCDDSGAANSWKAVHNTTLVY